MTAAPAGTRSRATVVGQKSSKASKRRVRFLLKVLGYTVRSLLPALFLASLCAAHAAVRRLRAASRACHALRCGAWLALPGRQS